LNNFFIPTVCGNIKKLYYNYHHPEQHVDKQKHYNAIGKGADGGNKKAIPFICPYAEFAYEIACGKRYKRCGHKHKDNYHYPAESAYRDYQRRIKTEKEPP
jgi:hypothetical protein